MKDICCVLNFLFRLNTQNYINCFIAKTAYLTETGKNCCPVNQNGSLTNTQTHKHTMPNMRDICCMLNFSFSLSIQNYKNCFIAKTAYLTETGNDCCHVNQNGSLTNTYTNKHTIPNMRDTANFLGRAVTKQNLALWYSKTLEEDLPFLCLSSVQITRDCISESSFFVNKNAGTCFLRAGKAENALVFELKRIQKIKTLGLRFDNCFLR